VNPEDAAEIYLRYYHEKKAEDSWILEKVDVATNSNIDEAWEITRAVIEKASSNEALAYVAAGPLENLLQMHGPAVIDRVEREAEKSEKFQLALSGVWGLEPGTPVFEWWYALMWKHGFAEGKRAPL
jgi:hypothetical protein